MKNKHPNAEEYADIIIRDERERIVSEKTIEYEPHRIERIYEMDDGAVVRYEWQDFPTGKTAENFNHRFTLITLPSPNPHNFKKGIIKTIDYSSSPR
ncbi:MAG TPA: hypothetical protein VK892_02750 [Pyrinomonadaceae bacterium]|nr:hypothetical protein [Pyrinomonadaceae bacterium]